MVGTACAYVQDYTRAKMAASRMYELIDRKSEIDSGSEEGEKPVSPYWNYKSVDCLITWILWHPVTIMVIGHIHLRRRNLNNMFKNIL